MERSRRIRLLVLVWMAAALAVLTAIGGWAAPPPAEGFALDVRIGAAYCVAIAICVWIHRIESRSLSRPQALSVSFLVALVTAVVNRLHFVMVDQGSYFIEMENSEWQALVHRQVMLLSPARAAHAARFLPNAVVRWLELGGMSFEAARDAYRLIFVLLLFYAIYRFARLYTTWLGGLTAVLLVAVIYPIGFANYAGQLTDPLSHLSFVLAFIFLAEGDFGWLFATIAIGSLAKESVLAVTGCYILFRREDRNYRWKACVLAGASALAYVGVRWYILHRAVHYADVSGVALEHAGENWQLGKWGVPLALTAGSLLPFLAAGWKSTPRLLKQIALFLLPVLFLTNLFFSWMSEVRNFMPLLFVLAVIAARTLVGGEDRAGMIPAAGSGTAGEGDGVAQTETD